MERDSHRLHELAYSTPLFDLHSGLAFMIPSSKEGEAFLAVQ